MLTCVAVVSFPLHAAEIQVYSGGAPQAALRRFASDFEQATGHKAVFTFGVVGEIHKRLASGERADVILLPAPMMDALDKAATLRRDSRVVVARVGIGVTVREGGAVPDVSTAEALRATLLRARSVAYPNPSVTPSGAHLARVMRELGIDEALRAKTTLRNAIDGGVALVANGDIELGMFLVSEIMPVKGVAFVGLLPSELQSYVVYAAAVGIDSASPEAGRTFLERLLDRSKRGHWKAAGFEPVSVDK